MDDPFEEGPECDFCNMTLDKDESLEPLYVGEQPQPKPHHLREVTKKSRARRELRVLGHRAEAYAALYKAIQTCPDMDLNISQVVDEVKNVDGHRTEFEMRRNDDLVGVSLKIRPKEVEDNPDAMVCEDCAEMFRSL